MSTPSQPEAKPAGRHKSPKALQGIPKDVAEFIGDRPIVQGENPQQYDSLFGRLAALIAPRDPIEWIWTKDIADAHWEARRARRFRDEILDLGRFDAMRRVAENLLQQKRCGAGFEKLVEQTVSSWMEADGEVKMATFLRQYDLDPSAIAAEVFMTRGQPYDHLERIAAAADKRRDALFREIERRRAWRAEQFRDASKIRRPVLQIGCPIGASPNLAHRTGSQRADSLPLHRSDRKARPLRGAATVASQGGISRARRVAGNESEQDLLNHRRPAGPNRRCDCLQRASDGPGISQKRQRCRPRSSDGLT